jgi:hypothetical protein
VYKKPKIKDGISVPPMRGIMEIDIFIQADEHQQGTHLVLIAKRLEKGGMMIVKVFLGPKNHGFVSVDGEVAVRIAGEIRKIITLE